MNFLRRLFSRKNNRTESKRLATALHSFLASDNWAESRSVLESHPELLTETADEMLLGFLLNSKDKSVRQQVAIRRTLLKRSRALGVEQAFAQLLPTWLQDILANLQESDQSKTDPRLRHIITYYGALSLVSHQDEPELWARLNINLANNLANFGIGEWEQNLE